MIDTAIGACLTGAIAFHGLSGTGSRWLLRHFQHSGRDRVIIATAAICVCAANLWSLIAIRDGIVGELIVAITMAFLAGVGVFLYRSATRPEESASNGRTILAVGAHPDDLELACGGTLAKLVDSGYEVHALVMSHGQVGGDSAQRPSEALAGGNFLGLTKVSVLNLPDTRLGQHNQEMMTAIEEKIVAIDPALILTHSVHDHHQDHHAVHLATLRAARQHSSILGFESPSTTRGFNPSVFVDIKSYIDIKVQAVQLHRNQAGKPYMSANRVRGMASFRGGQAKREFAEGFEPVRILAINPGVPL